MLESPSWPGDRHQTPRTLHISGAGTGGLQHPPTQAPPALEAGCEQRWDQLPRRDSVHSSPRKLLQDGRGTLVLVFGLLVKADLFLVSALGNCSSSSGLCRGARAAGPLDSSEKFLVEPETMSLHQLPFCHCFVVCNTSLPLPGKKSSGWL